MIRRFSLRVMSKGLLFFIGVSLSYSLWSQPTDGLIAYYSFDACDATEETGITTDGIIVGNAQCGCGISGNGFLFDGNTSIQILGNQDILFGNDFTLSFYMLPDPQSNAIMDVISKSEICGIDSTLELRYNPVTRNINLNLSQHSNLSHQSSNNLPLDRCYHHIAYVRRDRDLFFYYDGVQISKDGSASFVRIVNDGILTIGAGPCLANGEVHYRGVMDELRMYNRALTSSEIEELYTPIDKITSPDTVLFTGTSMQVRLPLTCAPNIQWSPSSGVSNTTIAEPVLTPPTTTTYSVRLNYGFCQAYDSIQVTVADSADLSCERVFFPTGFTPNGDNLNDDWGMSNVVFLGEFISLEVYDRWGGKVFRTIDPNDRWDGTKQGDEINPGSYAYVLTFRCDGSEKKQSGSVVLIR